MTLRAADYDTPAQIAETVLAHKLSTDTLMEEIRMKGGAYGAFAASDGLEHCFSLSTYRDPDPLRSLDTFAAALKSGGANFTSEDDVEKMIIGCYSRETRPRSPSEKSFVDLLRFLSRIDNGCRRRRLERLIAACAGEISAAREKLASQSPAGRVVIAGTKYAEKAAKALGVTVQTLPV
jgi:Zn-dependent M16 (insulinase) family peptidase